VIIYDQQLQLAVNAKTYRPVSGTSSW